MRPPKFTQAEFDSQLDDSIRRITQFQTLDKHCTFSCKCGHTWQARARFAISRGCPACVRSRQYAAACKSTKEYAKELKLKCPNLQLLGEYTSYYAPLRYRHKTCGHEFETAKKFPKQCLVCADDSKDAKTFAKLLPKTLRLLSYNTRHTRCEAKCLVCGEVQHTTANKLLTKGCSTCNISNKGLNRRKSNVQFVADLARLNPNVKALDEYTTANAKLRVQHTTCGHVWSVSGRRAMGARCPKCDQRKREVKLGRRKVLVMGYEDRALRYMSNIFSPKQIAVASDKTVPTIQYKFRGSNRRYYPDMYLEHINTIVEVKSLSTMGIGRNRFFKRPAELFYQNCAKAKAVISSGYKFKMLVMTDFDEPLRLPKNWYELRFKDFIAAITPGKTTKGHTVALPK